MQRPTPVIDDLSRPYWDGARDNRLVIQRCAECRAYVHPPRLTCSRCRSERLEAEQVTGRGRIYSWSVMRSPGNPGFEDRLPFAVVVVELDEQSGLLTVGNIEDCRLEEIEIGMPVEVSWERLDDEITLPQWRPATAARTDG